MLNFFSKTSAKTLLMMYVARTFDAFISIRALVLKSILSKYVEADELGKMFGKLWIEYFRLTQFEALTPYSLNRTSVFNYRHC